MNDTNENADERKPTGGETKPRDEQSPWPSAAIVAQKQPAGKAQPAHQMQLDLPTEEILWPTSEINPQDTRGGRFYIASAVVEMTFVGKFGRPIRSRLLRVDLGAAPFEFTFKGVPVRGRWMVYTFALQ
jgi:hypothetical protein